MTSPHHPVALTGSPDRAPAVRFLQILLLAYLYHYHSDAAFVAADPEAHFHA